MPKKYCSKFAFSLLYCFVSFVSFTSAKVLLFFDIRKFFPLFFEKKGEFLPFRTYFMKCGQLQTKKNARASQRRRSKCFISILRVQKYGFLLIYANKFAKMFHVKQFLHRLQCRRAPSVRPRQIYPLQPCAFVYETIQLRQIVKI